jgi:hypothetical protein
MNAIKKITFFAILILAIYSVACKKNNTENNNPVTPVDYSNINLRDTGLDIIKAAINGRWQIHYSMIFGWAGWTRHDDSTLFISFLSNDTIKREYEGMVTDYEKAVIIRKPSVMTLDSVYHFTYHNGQNYFIMDKIFNDTLKIESGSYFLYGTRKP